MPSICVDIAYNTVKTQTVTDLAMKRNVSSNYYS